MTRLFAALALLSLLASLPVLAAKPGLEDLLDFELGSDGGFPAGWRGGPPETIHADSVVVHGGQWACRIARDAEAGNSFTALSYRMPVEKQGRTITLKGWLKTENVSEFAGLWLRLDGNAGMVGFDNMQDRQLKGTHDWTEYTINVPFNAAARHVVFGALTAGQGNLWIDDLQLLVDGKPYAEAADVVREKTVLDTDTEFKDGSGFEATTLTPVQAGNLVRLGKVWGFLKYHHPQVTTGTRHWDFDLFRVLPDVLAASDAAAANAVMLAWIEDLGDVPACNPCAKLGADLDGKPRLDWLTDAEGLGAPLSRKLQEIHLNRPGNNKQFYVGQMPNVGNPIFARDLSYTEMIYPDPGYRLLALFRYWNIIEYWFPNRDIIDRDWDEVLAAYLPEILAAGDEQAYQVVLLQVIAEVKDGHANLYSANELRPPAGKCRLPLVIRFIEDQAVVTGYADSARGTATGLLVGDVIRKIDHTPVADLVREWGPYYPASNQPHRLSGMARNLTRGPFGPIQLEVERDGQVMTVEATRTAPQGMDVRAGMTHDLPGDTFQLLGDDVAYLKLSSVSVNESAGYVEQAMGTKGLIIDIRNYPSAFMVFALGSRLVSETTPFVCFTKGDLNNPGAFLWRPTNKLEPISPNYPGQVVVLVDEASMSQSEYTAMAFGAGTHAKVVGSTTAGADGNISAIHLPGGLRTHISGIGVFHPDRSPTQRVGIVPDVVVTPTVAGIRAGQDEVLEAGLRQILGAEVSADDLQARYR